MAQINIEISDELVGKLVSFEPHLPAVLDLALFGFVTPVAQYVGELIEFLTKATPDQVRDYHLPETVQARMARLLAVERTGMLSDDERMELDEMQRVERFLIVIKGDKI